MMLAKKGNGVWRMIGRVTDILLEGHIAYAGMLARFSRLQHVLELEELVSRCTKHQEK